MTTAEHRGRIDAAALNLWLCLRRAAVEPLSEADLELFSSVTQHPAIQNTLTAAVEQCARAAGYKEKAPE